MSEACQGEERDEQQKPYIKRAATLFQPNIASLTPVPHRAGLPGFSCASCESLSPQCFQLLFSLWGWDQPSPTKRTPSPVYSALRRLRRGAGKTASPAKRVALATSGTLLPGISQSVGNKNSSESKQDLEWTSAVLQQGGLTVRRQTKKQKEIISNKKNFHSETPSESHQPQRPQVDKSTKMGRNQCKNDENTQNQNTSPPTRDHNSSPAKERGWMENESDELT
ncbi:hypothetical protein AAY473_025179 [Plecturocebus cupreus]